MTSPKTRAFETLLSTVVGIAWGLAFTIVSFEYLAGDLSSRGESLGNEHFVKSLYLIGAVSSFAMFTRHAPELPGAFSEFRDRLRYPLSPFASTLLPGTQPPTALTELLGRLLALLQALMKTSAPVILGIGLMASGLPLFDTSGEINGYHVGMVGLLFVIMLRDLIRA